MTIREQILNAKDLSSEVIEVPEWGGVKVKVRGISQGARARLLKDTNNAQDTEQFVPSLLIATLVDPSNDQPIFSAPDRDALNEKGVRGIERVLKVAMRVCGFTEPEAIEKNSESRASDDSPSDSQNG